jgi:hypothetical protein
MKKAIFLAIVVILVFFALTYHFILMDNSVKILKKTEMTFENTFVDARGVKKAKLYLKPALVKAGIKNLFTDESITLEKQK